jgi:hypothetical protein
VVVPPSGPASVTTAPAATPVITGASIVGGFLMLTGPNGLIAIIPMPPGAVVLFTDVNGDGNGDVVLFSSSGVFVLDGLTGGFLAIFADFTGDRITDALLFSPPGTPKTFVLGGTGQVFVLS